MVESEIRKNVAVAIITLLIIFSLCIPLVQAAKQYLELNAPASVIENTNFIVTVTYEGDAVIGANVTFNDETKLSMGEVIFHAPSVDEDTVYTITANKSGFFDAGIKIIVQNVPLVPGLQLTITAPEKVVEGFAFIVTVTSESGPVQSALVLFDGKSRWTDAFGQVGFAAPSVENTVQYSISASREGYDGSEILITVEDVPSPSESELHIIAPASVVEGNTFLVNVTSNNVPIESVLVTFNEQSYNTSAEGTILLTAPDVDAPTNYSITAQKSGYLSATTHVTMIPSTLNDVNNGWIYGNVTNSSGGLLENVSICALSSTGETSCTVTNQQGQYRISVSPGTYTVNASKQGYPTTTFYAIVIQENQGYEQNMVLERIGETLPIITTDEPGDFALAWAVQNNLIGATLTASTQTITSTIYTPAVSIVGSSTSGGFLCTISGPETLNGTIVAMTLDEATDLLNTTVLELSKIVVYYDGSSIPIASSFGTFFNPDTSQDNPFWTAVIIGDKITVFVNVPHFSEHTIMIVSLEKIVEEFGGTIAAAVFFAVFLILGIMYFIPFFLVRKSK